MSRTHVKRRISRRGPRCSVFARLVVRGRIACRQLSKTQNDTVNARHVAFRPAHFRNVITSVLSQSCAAATHRALFASRFAAEFCGKFTTPLLSRNRRDYRLNELLFTFVSRSKFYRHSSASIFSVFRGTRRSFLFSYFKNLTTCFINFTSKLAVFLLVFVKF